MISRVASNSCFSEEDAGHPDAEVGVDLHELAAGDEAAVGCQLDGCAAVAAELDDVARLQARRAGRRSD